MTKAPLSVPYYVFWVGVLIVFLIRYFTVSREGKRKALGAILSTLGLIVLFLGNVFTPITSNADAAAVCLTLTVGLALFLSGGYLIFAKGSQS